MTQENKHVLAFRKTSNLKDGEEILTSVEGYIGEMMGKGDKTQHNGTLILTNKRVIFYRKGIFGEVLETMPIPKITSIETKTLMGHKVLCLHTSHDELAFKTFIDIQSIHDQLEELRDAHDAPTAPVTVASDDPFGMLEKLGALRDNGILTDEEFEIKKADLLARM